MELWTSKQEHKLLQKKKKGKWKMVIIHPLVEG